MKSISVWRSITVLLLLTGSCFLLSEAIAKGKTRSAVKTGKLNPTTPGRILAATPPSGTIDTTNQSLTYTDGPTLPNPTGILGAPDCTAPNSCSDFAVTVNASSLAATKNLTWSVGWTPPNVDQDIFVEDANHNLVANNNSTVDPSVIVLPIPPDGTVYHLVVAASVGTAPLTATVGLTDKFPAAQQGLGAPPRYINYPAPSNLANGDNEPSMGVDWNPNDPSLRVVQGQTRKNTGGVAFFTGDTIQWRNDFDDCSSPAINTWTDTNAPIITGLDPIGFVDHFASPPSLIGVGNPPPHTPGRIFGLDLAVGTSTCAFSDNDGASWTPIAAGNYPAGPDHETLGGGPYHAPVPTPPAPAYPNAIYYCSQNGVQNAECSRSDDGGISYGPGVPIFDPTVCGGGIHGHLKVSPQGTVYVPNSSCGEGNPIGANGVAMSTDNGITWQERNVPGSTGSQDPAIGIGQNNIGKPANQIPNTIYFGWISGDGHAHVAHSGDEGQTWQDETDISSIVGSENSVFPIVVAGDDNRAAYAFLGTDPSYQPKKVWHLYIATTYDGGKNWILVDATPDDPVQIGEVCLLGIGCNGARNLLDFNGIDVDSEGRVLVGYTDGCVNCANTQNIAQSSDGHGTIARQSGGRRLFSAFDPVEPAPPAAPQFLSVVRQDTNRVLLTWLKPDNGGSPITGYNIYRGSSSGGESFIAHVNGEMTLKYLDQTASNSTNWYYKIMAVNAIGESSYCHELNVNGVQPGANACQLPYLQTQGAAAASNDPTGQFSIQYVNLGEPFTNCTARNLTAIMKVNTLDPSGTGTTVVPPVSTYEVYFKIPGSANSTGQPQTLFVEYDNTTVPSGVFLAGWVDPATGSDCSTIYAPGDANNPASGTVAPDGTITMNLNFGTSPTFGTCAATGGVDMIVNANQWTPGLQITNIQGKTYQRAGGVITGVKVNKAATAGDGTYTTKGNLACLDVRPQAVLIATPQSGPTPLTVNFDASTSTDANPCTTIASYTMDFGDGSAPVTQASPAFSHTYNNSGDYAARLTVTDSAGQVSDATQIVISANSSAIELAGAVSRKIHGNVGPLDLILPLTGAPAIECRTGGANGNYQVIFVFPDTLTSVGSVTTSAGTVASSGVGLDTHQFIVNLTGVPNAQYVTVTLNNAHSGNRSGNVAVTMGVLFGDANGDKFCDAVDTSQTKSQSGHAVTTSNFREDVNADGFIDAVDTSLVKSKSGTALP
ncbi:MAG TPA: PKD domain-containing protein [Chthoniobacterales bacterium]|nr:PKD domain-containing protein [Chthoniobacterales bacterium]